MKVQVGTCVPNLMREHEVAGPGGGNRGCVLPSKEHRDQKAADLAVIEVASALVVRVLALNECLRKHPNLHQS